MAVLRIRLFGILRPRPRRSLGFGLAPALVLVVVVVVGLGPGSVFVSMARAEAAAPLAIRPSGFEIVGCSVFDDAELAETLLPFSDRTLTTSDLLELVDALRARYVAAGFTTTEVFLPDQDLDAGRVRIVVLEGRVEAIEIEGARVFREAFYRSRLARGTSVPLDVPKLTRALERLQAEPGIERIVAVLEQLGPARHRLHVEVREHSPWSVTTHASNHRSPSIGSLGGGVAVAHPSLFGFGDRVGVEAQLSEGLRDLGLSWSLPVGVAGTRLHAGYRRGRAEIVEDEFADLDIEGRFESVTFGISHPLLRARSLELWVDLSGDWRRAASSIFGRVECFQADLADCTPTVAALRARQELVWRTRTRAVGLRSTISLGVDALGATRERDSGGRDGEFVSGLLQGQWAELLPPIAALAWADGTQVVLRADYQWATDPLVAIEQIAIGGARSVRGYRENQLVRDNGVSASLELRVPVWKSGFGRPIVELAPFVDYGSAWDRRRGRSPDETLASVGLGLRIAPTEQLRAELSFGHRLREVEPKGDRLQRNGFSFEVVWDVF